MIHRFLYHGFWNFYDHLGTLILWGTVHALLALGIIVCGVSLLPENTNILLAWSGIGFIQISLLTAVLAALMPYCARAARGEPARWPDLLHGLKTKWASIAINLMVWVLVVVVLCFNFILYIKLQNQITSPVFHTLLIVIDAIIGWTILGLCILLPSWLCAITAYRENTKIRTAIGRSMMAIALLPGVWICSVFIGLILIIIGVYTRIGLVLLVPILCSFSQTAYYLTAQYADFLTLAKEKLGENQPLKAYKKAANEIACEWEHRQPRRTFKELIRPWDY